MELLMFFMALYTFLITSSPYSLVAATSDAHIINHWPFPVEEPVGSNLWLLAHEGNQSLLVHHRCDRDTLLYISGSAYLTRDDFATALDPLYIPSHLLQEGTGSPVLQSATFAGNNLVMAVSGIILTYDLKTVLVSTASGVPNDVAITQVASFQCCYNDTEWCQKQDNVVVAYNRHSPSTHRMEYFVSFDAGRTFAGRHLQPDFDIKHEIFGATVLGTLSAAAFLVIKDNSDSAQFVYDDINPTAINMIKPVSLPFSVSGNQTSLVQFESGVGSLVIWDSKNIYYSAVSGKAVVKADIHSQSSFLVDDEVVKQVITNKHGDLAVLTSGGSLYFGREGLPPKIVKLPLKSLLPCPGHSCVILFTKSNNIKVLYSANTEGVDFPPAAKLQLLSKVIQVQHQLAKVTPALQTCEHQGFVASFHDQLFYLDLGQQLELNAKVIPGAWQKNSYMVTVSNPGILSVNTSREETGPQARGVVITNLLAHITLVADTLPNGHKDEARGMSTLRMSVYDSSLICQHKQQAVARVVAGCPPNRNIRVRKSEDECPSMRDYIYTIDKDVYDPTFLLGSTGIAATVDKNVLYDYNKLGCPIVVYYQDTLKPVIDLYEGEVFIEEVKEDYIVNEVNGIFTYSYAQTAQQAGCKSQPQSWLPLLTSQDSPNPATAWTRRNYRSCMKEDSNGLTNPDQPYEIFSSRNSNHLKWSQHNGILVLNVSVLNPDYSLCQLQGQFAVQVYGVLPKSTLAPLRIMVATCGLGLATLVAFYIILRLWPADGEKGGKKGGEDTQKM